MLCFPKMASPHKWLIPDKWHNFGFIVINAVISHLTESFNIFHHIIRYFGPIWNPIIFSEPNSELVPSNPS